MKTLTLKDNHIYIQAEPGISIKLAAAFSFLLTLFSLQTVSAQAHHNPGPRHATIQKIARIQTRIMAGRMNLKPVQKQQVNELNQRYMDKLTALLHNKTISKEEKLQSLQKMREEKKTEMKVLLSEDQYKEYLKIQEDLKEERKQRIKDLPEESDPEQISAD